MTRTIPDVKLVLCGDGTTEEFDYVNSLIDKYMMKSYVVQMPFQQGH